MQLSYRSFAICIAQLYPYNQGKLCTVNTTTGLVYTESSTKGGSFVVLDGVNCTEYRLSSDNDGNSGELVLSVPLSVFQNSYKSLHVSIYVFRQIMYAYVFTHVYDGRYIYSKTTKPYKKLRPPARLQGLKRCEIHSGIQEWL